MDEDGLIQAASRLGKRRDMNGRSSIAQAALTPTNSSCQTHNPPIPSASYLNGAEKVQMARDIAAMLPELAQQARLKKAFKPKKKGEPDPAELILTLEEITALGRSIRDCDCMACYRIDVNALLEGLTEEQRSDSNLPPLRDLLDYISITLEGCCYAHSATVNFEDRSPMDPSKPYTTRFLCKNFERDLLAYYGSDRVFMFGVPRAEDYDLLSYPCDTLWPPWRLGYVTLSEAERKKPYCLDGVSIAVAICTMVVGPGGREGITHETIREAIDADLAVLAASSASYRARGGPLALSELCWDPFVRLSALLGKNDYSSQWGIRVVFLPAPLGMMWDSKDDPRSAQKILDDMFVEKRVRAPDMVYRELPTKWHLRRRWVRPEQSDWKEPDWIYTVLVYAAGACIDMPDGTKRAGCAVMTKDTAHYHDHTVPETTTCLKTPTKAKPVPAYAQCREVLRKQKESKTTSPRTKDDPFRTTACHQLGGIYSFALERKGPVYPYTRSRTYAAAQEKSFTNIADRCSKIVTEGFDAETFEDTVLRLVAELRLTAVMPEELKRRTVDGDKPTADEKKEGPAAQEPTSASNTVPKPTSTVPPPPATPPTAPQPPPEPTAERAELRAFLAALQITTWDWRDCGNLVVATNSAYVFSGATEMLPRWLARGWRTSKKKPIKNVDLWMAVLANTEALAKAGVCVLLHLVPVTREELPDGKAVALGPAAAAATGAGAGMMARAVWAAEDAARRMRPDKKFVTRVGTHV